MSVFDDEIASAWATRDAARGGSRRGRAGAGAPRRGAGVAAFVLAICTAGALVHVAVRIKGLEVAYDLGRERRIASEMEEQRRRLQIEIGMLKDPGRVISIARERLNMGPPTQDAIWRLGAGAGAAGVTSTRAPDEPKPGKGKPSGAKPAGGRPSGGAR
jgi:cell division protein FtsL